MDVTIHNAPLGGLSLVVIFGLAKVTSLTGIKVSVLECLLEKLYLSVHCLEIGDLDRFMTTKEKFLEYRGLSMLPILLTFCWTGCLNTSSLHRGKIDLEKNYRKVSCLACGSSPASLQEACLHGPHTPVTFWSGRGGEGCRDPEAFLPGTHTSSWATWG